MKLSDVQEILNAKVICGQEHLDRKVFSACSSDLMSDVLAFVKEKVVLMTGLVNPQVIRTAEMMDIRSIVFVRGKVPTDDVVKLAQAKNMVIMTTEHTLFIASGLLYSNGLDCTGGEE